MKRFPDIAFSLSTAVAALLFGATLVAWARSYSLPWTMNLGTPLHNGSLETGNEWAWRITSSEGTLNIEPVCSFYSWHTPYWKFAALWLILPARCIQLRLRPWWSARKDDDRRCSSCGYDRSASPDQCPECGQVVTVGAKA